MINLIKRIPSIFFQGIEFRNTTMLESGLYDVINKLKTNTFKDSAVVGDREVFSLGMGDILVSYPSAEQRNEEQKNMMKFEGHKDTLSQFPRFRGEFEYLGKFFNIVGVNDVLEGATTDILYKGVVVNTIEYIKKHPVGVVEGVKDITGDVIGDGKIK